MVLLYVSIAVVVVAVLWLVGVYNGLIALKHQTLNGWKQIDVQLKRRHDLIPNLVETVKGAMNFEQKTMTAVIEARNKASRLRVFTRKPRRRTRFRSFAPAFAWWRIILI
jgi:LemA protein